MSENCPNCPGTSYSLNDNELLGLKGGYFCPDCGYRESVGACDKRFRMDDNKSKKLNLVKELDDLISQLTLSDTELLWIIEWKIKFQHFLDGV